VIVSIPLAGLNRSGGVRTLVLVANAMAARGWTVRLVVPAYASQSAFELHPAVERRVIATPRALALAVPLYYCKLAWHAARGADLCVANFYATAYCALISRLTWPRARIVYFLQGDEAVSHGTLAGAGRLSRTLRHLLAKFSYRLPLRTVCVSRWLRDRIGRPDSVVVGHGLDLATFRAASPRTAAPVVTVGTIGGSSVAKGYPDFLAAVERLPADVRRRMQVIVVADHATPLPVGLPAERADGRSEQAMAAFYNRCDVFVFASRSEGFGLPPLEAMACGCAVLTTDCGGVRDYIEPGVNALVVPVADADALSAAIVELVERPELREALSRRGTATAGGRSRETMLTELVEALAV
jgi:glycosyltransferase involved in cell wall biosynthesis